MDVTKTSKVQTNAAQTNDIQTAITRKSQMTTSPAKLPPEIWVKIFGLVPAKERLVIPAVCPPWRSLFLKTPSCWRDIRLGRNVNCYSTTPPTFDRADYFPLNHVEEIEFTPAIPAVMDRARQDGSKRFVSTHLKAIPCDWLELALRHAVKLKRLNLAATWVTDENMAAFR